MTLQLIGAGFGRTGTSSLRAALAHLGVEPCYHMLELMARPEHSKLWLAADGGESIAWPEIFGGYSATVDWPACIFWRELLAAYPKARVILTVRDAAKWYASFRDTILVRLEGLRPVTSPTIRAVHELGQQLILRRTFRGSAGDESAAISALEAHNASVIAAVDPHNLLIYDVADGWEPLCAFLDVPVPAKPFPTVNARTEFSELLRNHAPDVRRSVASTGS